MAGEADELDGEVAVVGAGAFLGVVDQLEQAVGLLAGVSLPAVEGLVGEAADGAARLAHQGLEALLVLAVAFAVEVDDRGLGGERGRVAEPEQRLGLAGAGGADDEHREAGELPGQEDLAAALGRKRSPRELVAEEEAAPIGRRLGERACSAGEPALASAFLRPARRRSLRRSSGRSSGCGAR